MRIMTYNIRLGIQRGLRPVADLIAAAGPDIVALQEVGRFWTMGPTGDTARELAELAGYAHYAYAPTIICEPAGANDEPACYGHALLSRYPIISHEVVALPQIEDEPRAMLFCTIATDSGELEVLSTHLSHLSSDRPTQAEVLLDHVDSWGTDRVRLLMGDLNEGPHEAWVGTLCDILSDADRHQSRPTFPAHDPKLRIDYLLAAGANWTDPEVIDDPETSDHRPLVATLTRQAAE